MIIILINLYYNTMYNRNTICRLRRLPALHAVAASCPLDPTDYRSYSARLSLAKD